MLFRPEGYCPFGSYLNYKLMRRFIKLVGSGARDLCSVAANSENNIYLLHMYILYQILLLLLFLF